MTRGVSKDSRRSSARLRHSIARSSLVDYSHIERKITQPEPEHISAQLPAPSASGVSTGKRRRVVSTEMAISSGGATDLIEWILKQSGLKNKRLHKLMSMSIEDLVDDLNQHEAASMENDGITADFTSDDAANQRQEALAAILRASTHQLKSFVKCVEALSRSAIRKVRILSLEASAQLIQHDPSVVESVIIPRVADISAVVRKTAVEVLAGSLAMPIPEPYLATTRTSLLHCLENEPDSTVRAAALLAMATVLSQDSSVVLFGDDERQKWCDVLVDCCYDSTVRIQTAAGKLMEALFDNDEEMASEDSPLMSNQLRFWWILWDKSANSKLQDSVARIVSKYILAEDLINSSPNNSVAWGSLKDFIEAYSPFRDNDGRPDDGKLCHSPAGRAVASFVRLAPFQLNTASCWAWARPYLLDGATQDDQQIAEYEQGLILDILRVTAQIETMHKGSVACVLPPFDLKALCDKFSDNPVNLINALAIATATSTSRIDKMHAFRVCFRRLEQLNAVTVSGG